MFYYLTKGNWFLKKNREKKGNCKETTQCFKRKYESRDIKQSMVRQRTQIQYDINYILQPKQIFESKTKAHQTNHKKLLWVKVRIIHQHSLKAKIPRPGDASNPPCVSKVTLG